MSVVSFAAAKLKREPHGCGIGRCHDCKHEWEHQAPVGTTYLTCPQCGSKRGMWKYSFGPVQGDVSFRCNHCDAEHFYGVKRAGRIKLLCSGCGFDQTMTLSGEG